MSEIMTAAIALLTVCAFAGAARRLGFLGSLVALVCVWFLFVSAWPVGLLALVALALYGAADFPVWDNFRR